MNTPLVLFHARCADGFSAAWAVWLAHPDWEFYPAVHGQEPPYAQMFDREVWLLDFCYPREQMERILDTTEKVWVLDHHQSAMQQNHDLLFREHRPLRGVFDMGRSGAGITWDWFHPNKPRPALLDRVEDRDLWKFKYPDTKAVQGALFSYPYNFATWSLLMLDTPLEELRVQGEAIMRKHMKDVQELIDAAKQTQTIAGFEVPVLNAPYFYGSEAGHVMSQGAPFAATYYDAAEGRRFGLRSNDDGVDVSAIAMKFGGGGHRNAAGFTIKGKFDWSLVA